MEWVYSSSFLIPVNAVVKNFAMAGKHFSLGVDAETSLSLLRKSPFRALARVSKSKILWRLGVCTNNLKIPRYRSYIAWGWKEKINYIHSISMNELNDLMKIIISHKIHRGISLIKNTCNLFIITHHMDFSTVGIHSEAKKEVASLRSVSVSDCTAHLQYPSIRLGHFRTQVNRRKVAFCIELRTRA